MPYVEHIAAKDVRIGDLIGGSRVIHIQKHLTSFVGYTYEFSFGGGAPYNVHENTELEVIRGVEVGPADATTHAELRWFVIDGEKYEVGDYAWITHIPSGSRVYAQISGFYGVGRIRGARVHIPFVGDWTFPFSKPEDRETYKIEPLEKHPLSR